MTRSAARAMLRELAQLDPERAAKLHARDKKRVVRAYEVYLLTGKTITELDAESRLKPPDFDAAYIILGWASREEMYAHIDARVDEMVGRGLFAEVEALLAEGLLPASTGHAGHRLQGGRRRAARRVLPRRGHRDDKARDPSLREAPANLAAPPRGGPAHRLAGQTRFCVRRPGFDRISAPLRYMIVAYRAR